jgi:uncharacterized membrane protein YadS
MASQVMQVGLASVSSRQRWLALAAIGSETDFRKLTARRPEASAAGRVGLVLHLHFALVLVKLTAYS